MQLRSMMILAGIVLTVGCAAERPELEKPVAAGDTIRFSAGPCFGVCPTYSLQVTPDGSGLLEPERCPAGPGATRLTVTPAQYRRFRAALAQFRPPAGTVRRIAHGENCTRFATDMPGYTIEWTRDQQPTTRLEFQSGCMDASYGKLRATIAAVPRMLDIDAMVKPSAVR